MFHKVTVVGYLGGDPETRFLQSGSSVCSFSVATKRSWTNKDGSPGEETIWWRASAWGKLGEICQSYLNKGRLVLIEGSMVPDRETNGPRVWMDQNGQPRAGYDLRVENMKMLGRRTDTGGYGGGYNQGYGQNQGRPQAQQYGAPAPQRQAAPPRQAPAPQRQAPPPQRQAAAPQQQYNAPPARQAPAQRTPPPPPQPARRDRRSTMSAPQNNDFGDEDFGPDDIPF